MTRWLAAVRKGLSRGLEWLVIVSMAALTLDVLWGVFTRYVVGHQTRWTEELATSLLIWVGLLGGALAFGEKSHLGVDYFVGKLDPAAQRLNRLLVNLLVMAFAATVMVYGGAALVHKTLESKQVLSSLGWPRGYVYLAVPVSGAFILLYGVEAILEDLAGRSAGTKEA